METLNSLTSVIEFMLGLVALGGIAAGGVLWAIKLCVERLLKEIKEELNSIKVIITHHTNSHQVHSQLIEQLESRAESHEQRLIILEELRLRAKSL